MVHVWVEIVLFIISHGACLGRDFIVHNLAIQQDGSSGNTSNTYSEGSFLQFLPNTNYST
jgi:hypothetical protein